MFQNNPGEKEGKGTMGKMDPVLTNVEAGHEFIKFIFLFSLLLSVGKFYK